MILLLRVNLQRFLILVFYLNILPDLKYGEDYFIVIDAYRQRMWVDG